MLNIHMLWFIAALTAAVNSEVSATNSCCRHSSCWETNICITSQGLTLYRSWRFLTGFTRTCQWSLIWARYIQSMSSHPVCSVTSVFNMILLSTPRSSNRFLSFRVSYYRNPMCIYFPSHLYVNVEYQHYYSLIFSFIHLFNIS